MWRSEITAYLLILNLRNKNYKIHTLIITKNKMKIIIELVHLLNFASDFPLLHDVGKNEEGEEGMVGWKKLERNNSLLIAKNSNVGWDTFVPCLVAMKIHQTFEKISSCIRIPVFGFDYACGLDFPQWTNHAQNISNNVIEYWDWCIWQHTSNFIWNLWKYFMFLN